LEQKGITSPVMKKNTKKTTIRRGDIILTATFLITAVLIFTCYNLFFHNPGTSVQITADGRIINTLPLASDTTIIING